MSELEALKRISAYIAENKINSTLKPETDMVDKENQIQDINDSSTTKAETSKEDVDNQHFDCIYNDEPLGFEKDPMAPKKMQPQDPLEEIDPGKEGDKRPTFISVNIYPELRSQAGDFLGFVVHKNGIEVNQSKTKAIMDIKPPSTKKELQSLLGKINFLRRFISNLSGKTKAFSPLLQMKNEDFIWQSQHQEAFDRIKEYLTKPPILAPPVRSRPMRLYIAVSESTIGSMLVQENEKGVERPVYYLIRMLNDPETRYSDIEKLCLCLYFSCMKLKQYIKPVDVYVSLHSDIIKHMLSKPILHSLIGKWALALIEYSLTYAPLKAMKGQVVADFLVDHSMVEIPKNYVDLAPWKLYFDGSSHKYGTGIGGIIISPDGIPAEFKYSIAGMCTNNEAEYEALITGLELLLELGARNVEIMGDSELVVKQVSKEYKCVKENLIMYLVVANRLLRRFKSANIRHIPRQENQEANDLAQEVSRYKRGGDEEPIQKTPEGVLLKCLGESKAYLAVLNVHSGACGAHQVGNKMKCTLMRSGVYWPSMLKDFIEFTKGCQECHMHGGIQHVPASELHAIVMPWLFRGWALDVIGEIKPASSKQQRYILVGIDYFTKWVEAIALRNVDQEAVIDFIQDHIICRFGIPETITTDQGTVFTGKKMQEFAQEVDIKLLTSTPYYAQENGQVEAANKVIINLIKKYVGKKPKTWHHSLSQALWACRTSPKEATGTTPFRLTYGHDVVLPVEVYVQSVRIQRQHEIPFEDYWSMMRDELVDLDEERMLV
ncbi:uncharacterized protein LOC131604940 [Vicia villosa]|uniref:uncharacterized protein LOC131604940 n=1 Tax=Vicia villosa TaxID=3911 RepID=UPI00273CF3C3|nr:uncharacterized protein LOC131604940 [Vicia villosa]